MDQSASHKGCAAHLPKEKEEKKKRGGKVGDVELSATKMADERQDRQQTQKTSSKYDFVKVRVWLADHYYTFSRFLVSRVLTVTQVPMSIIQYPCDHDFTNSAIKICEVNVSTNVYMY